MGTVGNTVRAAKILGFLVKKGLLNDATAKALGDAKDQLFQSAGIVLSGGKEAVVELTSAVVRELPKVKLSKVVPDSALVDLFTQEEALENLVLPLTRDGRVVEAAITEESDFLFIIRRQLMKGLIFRFKSARVTDLTAAINKYYESNKVEQSVPAATIESTIEQPVTPSAVRANVPRLLLDNILIGAVSENYQEVRFNFVGGVLTVVCVNMKDEIDEINIPNNLHEPIIRLLREKAGLNSDAANIVVEKPLEVKDAIQGRVHRFNIVFSDIFGNQSISVFPQ